MDGLAEVLELLYTADDRVATFQATIHRWSDTRAAQEAWEHWISGGGGSRASLEADVSTAPSPQKRIREETSRLWVSKPWLSRHERDPESGEGYALRLHDGRVWLEYHPQRGAVSNFNAPGSPSPRHLALNKAFKEMLDPSSIISEIRIESLETSTEAGREAILVSATPRHEDVQEQTEALWPGADAYQLAVDAAYGILLRVRAMRKGTLLGEDHISDVRINEPIPDDVFTFVPPPGVRVRDFKL